MADDSVKSEASAQQEGDHGDNETGSSNGGALSKRQRKKLLKQQKWEEERELRK